MSASSTTGVSAATPASTDQDQGYRFARPLLPDGVAGYMGSR